MDIITRYALEQLHKEGITLDMLITALDNLDKIEGYGSSEFIGTLIKTKNKKDSNSSSSNVKYKVLIIPPKCDRIVFVKLIRDAFGLGLEEAKDAVDSAPCILNKWVTIEEFHTIRDWIIRQDDRFADNIRLNL